MQWWVSKVPAIPDRHTRNVSEILSISSLALLSALAGWSFFFSFCINRSRIKIPTRIRVLKSGREVFKDLHCKYNMSCIQHWGMALLQVTLHLKTAKKQKNSWQWSLSCSVLVQIESSLKSSKYCYDFSQQRFSSESWANCKNPLLVYHCFTGLLPRTAPQTFSSRFVLLK